MTMDSEQLEVIRPTSAGSAELDEAVLDEGLASLAANRDRPYYDAAADADAAAQYYSAVDATASGAELLRALRGARDADAYAYAALQAGSHGVPVGGPASRPPTPVDILRQVL